MTMLFRMKNLSHDDSMKSSFTNLKEKLVEYEKNIEVLWIPAIKWIICCVAIFSQPVLNEAVFN